MISFLPIVRNFWNADKILRLDSGLLITSPRPAFSNFPSTLLVFSELTSASMICSSPWLGSRPVVIMNFSFVASASVIAFRKETFEALPSELWNWTIASRTTMLKISTESAMACTGSMSFTD